MTLGRILLLGIVAFVVGGIAAGWPDIQRCLKMRSM
jgi:hypothetical protein